MFTTLTENVYLQYHRYSSWGGSRADHLRRDRDVLFVQVFSNSAGKSVFGSLEELSSALRMRKMPWHPRYSEPPDATITTLALQAVSFSPLHVS